MGYYFDAEQKIKEFKENLYGIELPNSKITYLGAVGEGYTDIEEFNTPDYPPTARIVFESSFGADSLIKSELWLPENWNGELLGLGNGGYGGSLISKYWTYTTQGFAAVETDMGTSRLKAEDFPKFSYEVLKDYSWRSTHIMTVVAKMLTEAFYGKAPTRSFFIGSSAGGLQGYSEVQRFPEDYDGIVVGVPSNNALNYHIYNIWLFQKLVRADGNQYFSSADAEKINRVAVEFFRSRGDGEEGDDFISFPYIDENTVDSFIAYLGERLPEFDKEQLHALSEAYKGPRHSKTGAQIFSGLPIGSEIFCGYMTRDIKHTRCGNKWFDPYLGVLDKSQNLEFADDYEELLLAIDPHIGAHNPDLSEFMKRGGKIISYSGVADRSGPFGDMLKYYNRVCERLGGYDEVSKFFRHFSLPGKAHGNNGRGANVYWGDEENQTLLERLRVWRETNGAPEYLTIAHETKTEEGEVSYSFVRRVYPYRADMIEGKDFPKTTDDEYLNTPQCKE